MLSRGGTMGTARYACFLVVLPLWYVCVPLTLVCSSVSPTSPGHALFLNPSILYHAMVGGLRLKGGEDGSVRAGGDSGSSPPVPRGFMQRFLIKDVFASESLLIGTRLVVCGWAKTIRLQGSGKFAFLELNDGSCFKSLQVFAEPNTEGWQELVKNTHAHTSWRVTGKLVESPGSGQSVEVQAEGLQLLGSCSPDSYPLAKVAASSVRLSGLKEAATGQAAPRLPSYDPTSPTPIQHLRSRFEDPQVEGS